MKRLVVAMVMVGVVCSNLPGEMIGRAYAQMTTEEKKKEMQKQLNDQVMSAPFSVPDEAQVKAYIETQQKQGVVPPPYRGRWWRPGYTCYNLAQYSHPEYLSCRYYYHYYGYYYR